MLSKNNTPSAKAFAEQRYRKADSLTECRQSEKHIEPDKGGYCQVTEKNGLIFLEGAQFAACPLHSAVKKYPSYRISEQHTDR